MLSPLEGFLMGKTGGSTLSVGVGTQIVTTDLTDGDGGIAGTTPKGEGGVEGPVPVSQRKKEEVNTKPRESTLERFLRWFVLRCPTFPHFLD